MISHPLRALCLSLSLGLCLASESIAQTKVSIALDWTLNTNHIGLIIAREIGFYEQEGLEVDILPFSDTSSVALLASGSADFGYLTSLGFMSARASGADITALWATMQREAGRLVYNSNNTKISRPADLSGKVYAGFGSAWEAALIGTMIANDGGKPTWDTVTLGTGAYEALANGAVDFTLEVATWEGVNSTLLNREQKSFTYAEYGVPDQQTGYISTKNDFLKNNPELVAAFMRATQKGYSWAADNPTEAAALLIEAGDFPNTALVEGSMNIIIKDGYLRHNDKPIGWLDTERFATMAKFLFDSGVLKSPSGETLTWPGNVSGWYNQDWMP